MKHLYYCICIMVAFSCKTRVNETYYPSIHGLIHRVAPQLEGKILIDSIASENGKEVFEIYSEGSKIVLAGSTPVAAASALNWYLKYYCHCHISRAGENLNIPEELPEVKEKIRIASPYKYRYWLNYCTHNYTMSFWTWKEWERELDWMALNGINFALIITGTEKVWQNTLKQFNFSDKEISDFISGPAYQAWWLMENLEGLDVRYGKAGSWRGEWTAGPGTARGELPDRVELKFRFSREDELTARFRVGLRG